MKLTSCWVFPFGLYEVNGQITSYELEQKPKAKEIPMLISNTVQRKLKICIELANKSEPDRVCFRAWDNDFFNLERAPSGNPASSLLQFAMNGHPGVEELGECYTVVLEPCLDTWDGGDGVMIEEDESALQAEATEMKQQEDDEQFTNRLLGFGN